MIINTAPVMMPPSMLNSAAMPEANEPFNRIGGGGTTSVETTSSTFVPEAPRPVEGIERGEAGQANNERANADPQPGRSDLDLAAELRFGIAVDQSLVGAPNSEGVSASANAPTLGSPVAGAPEVAAGSQAQSGSEQLQQRINGMVEADDMLGTGSSPGLGAGAEQGMQQRVSEFA